MIRSLISLSLVAPVYFAGSQVLQPNRPAAELGGPLTPCPNVIAHEPIVVYEVSGSTLLGPTDLSLIVYSDGALRLSSSSANEGAGKIASAAIDAEDAAQLAADLVATSVGKGCDQNATVTDMPLKTLTLLRGDAHAKAHSHSWWTANGSEARAEFVLESFIAAAFPNF